MDLHEHQRYVDGLTRRVAKRMVGTAGLEVGDIEDLEQDLRIDLLERMPRFKPDRGDVRAFIARIVKNKAASIISARRAAKRNGGAPLLSLSHELEDEDGDSSELHESISVDDYLRRTRGTTLSECDRRDLGIDLRKVLESLSPQRRVVCLLLIDHTVCDVANVVGIPRSTLRDVIRSLRDDRAMGRLMGYLR